MDEMKISPKELECNSCNTTIEPPTHCGRPMNLENNNTKWVCWKGVHEPCCGKDSVEDFIPCCDTPELGTTSNILL